jgi:predicted PurR-regulated permease PerM
MSDTPSTNAPGNSPLWGNIASWKRRLIISATWLVWLVLFVFIIFLLNYIQVALWVLIISALIAYAILPLINLCHRIMPRPLAITVVYLIIVGVLFLLLYLIFNTGVEQIKSLAASIRNYVTPGPHGRSSPIVQILQRIGLSQIQLNALGSALQSQLTSAAANLAKDIVPVISGVLYALALILFTGVISIYLIVDGQRFVQRVRQNVPQSTRAGTRRLLQILRDVVGGYIRGEVVLCIIIGFLVGLGMFALRVPYPAFLGTLATFLEFVPVIGVLISGALCVLLALTQGWILALIVLAYFIVIHIIEGYVLVPRIVGRAVGLNPAITLLAMIAADEIFGLIGAILAAPLAGLIQSLFASFWLYYRETHQAEFAGVQQELPPREPPPHEPPPQQT